MQGDEIKRNRSTHIMRKPQEDGVSGFFPWRKILGGVS
jgi:hypothetical protein